MSRIARKQVPAKGSAVSWLILGVLVLVLLFVFLGSAPRLLMYVGAFKEGYDGAQDKARNYGVVANTQNVRVALEQFAIDSGGKYPLSAEEATMKVISNRSYMAGGVLPRTPWSTQQKRLLSVVGTLLGKSPDSLTSVGTSIGLGSSGKNFASIAEYGCIVYGASSNGSNYVLYGIGRDQNRAIVVSAFSKDPISGTSSSLSLGNSEEMPAGSGESESYLKFVKLRRIQVAETIINTPGVFGEIKNTGIRTLNRVEIKVLFLDKKGIPVAEKVYSPVAVSKYSYDDEGPLRPNYSRKFGYRADDAPSDWAKKVKVSVQSVEFAD